MTRQEAAFNYLKHIIEAFRSFDYELDSEDMNQHFNVAQSLSLQMPLTGGFDPTKLREEIENYIKETKIN